MTINCKKCGIEIIDKSDVLYGLCPDCLNDEPGNKAWAEKEAKRLAITKGIYKTCSCRAEGITDEQIDDLDDTVYDMMCKACWEKLKVEENRLFPQKESLFLGAGNSEERMHVVLRRDAAKPIVSRLLFSCLLRDEAQHLELHDGIQHFKNDDYDIDIITVSDRVYLIVRCEDAFSISRKIYEWLQKVDSKD